MTHEPPARAGQPATGAAARLAALLSEFERVAGRRRPRRPREPSGQPVEPPAASARTAGACPPCGPGSRRCRGRERDGTQAAPTHRTDEAGAAAGARPARRRRICRYAAGRPAEGASGPAGPGAARRHGRPDPRDPGARLRRGQDGAATAGPARSPSANLDPPRRATSRSSSRRRPRWCVQRDAEGEPVSAHAAGARNRRCGREHPVHPARHEPRDAGPVRRPPAHRLRPGRRGVAGRRSPPGSSASASTRWWTSATPTGPSWSHRCRRSASTTRSRSRSARPPSRRDRSSCRPTRSAATSAPSVYGQDDLDRLDRQQLVWRTWLQQIAESGAADRRPGHDERPRSVHQGPRGRPDQHGDPRRRPVCAARARGRDDDHLRPAGRRHPRAGDRRGAGADIAGPRRPLRDARVLNGANGEPIPDDLLRELVMAGAQIDAVGNDSSSAPRRRRSSTAARGSRTPRRRCETCSEEARSTSMPRPTIPSTS